MIDVLAFPPDDQTLEALRTAELSRSRRLEQQARIALFISVGLAFAWAADVGAAFGARPSGLTLAFGIASVVLAIAIVGAHLVARRLSRRAAALHHAIDRRYAEVRIADAHQLVALASTDRVVAQYLRMVGRQSRALRRIELASLIDWASHSRLQTNEAFAMENRALAPAA